MEKIELDNLSLNNWEVKGNDLYSFINGFGLIISIESFDQERYENRTDLSFEQTGIGFLLTVISINENKKTYCAFTSLQETIYFVNSYIEVCNSVSDVCEKYNSYRISDDSKNRNGYS